MRFDRFIIILPGLSKHYGGRKAGDFLYREEHKAFVYKGNEFPIDLFNAIAPKVIETNRNFVAELPFVRLLEAAPETLPAEAEVEDPGSILSEDARGLLERLQANTLTAADVNRLTERCVASGFPVGPPPAAPVTEPVPSPPSPPLPVSTSPETSESPAPAVSEEGSGKGSPESEAAGSPPAAEGGDEKQPEKDPAPPAKKASGKKPKAAPKPKAKDDEAAE